MNILDQGANGGEALGPLVPLEVQAACAKDGRNHPVRPGHGVGPGLCAALGVDLPPWVGAGGQRPLYAEELLIEGWCHAHAGCLPAASGVSRQYPPVFGCG